jgi:hypothetical protein
VIEPTSDQQTRNPRAVVWKDVLGPGPVLPIAITVFILTACVAPGEWVTNAAISWLVTTVAVACALLLAARPLTPLRERSHLVGRLGWLVSFMLAAVLLCLSAFVGAIAGAQVRIDQTGLQLGHLGALLRSVLSIAIGGGLFLFFVWLAADVWRLGPDGRLAAIVRGAICGATVARSAGQPIHKKMDLGSHITFLAHDRSGRIGRLGSIRFLPTGRTNNWMTQPGLRSSVERPSGCLLAAVLASCHRNTARPQTQVHDRRVWQDHHKLIHSDATQQIGSN